MTLRKMTVYNSVRCIPQSEQTRDIKPNLVKIISLPREQNKKISRNSKLSLEII